MKEDGQVFPMSCVSKLLCLPDIFSSDQKKCQLDLVRVCTDKNCWSKKKQANHKILLLKNWALDVQLTNCFYGQGWLLLLAKTTTITIQKVVRKGLSFPYFFHYSFEL